MALIPSKYSNFRACFLLCLLCSAMLWCLFWIMDHFLSYPLCLRRSVRSDAQLSSTETRFQECSQSGKTGSKHPMLSISMAKNVISYKKSKEMLKKPKSLILRCKFGARALKWPKIAEKTDHSIAIYSFFCIGMVYFRCLLVNPHVQAV